jgi:hypothetical protein
VGALALIGLGQVHAGTILGEAKLLDDGVRRPTIVVSKDQDYCGETLPNETYVSDVNGGLKNVVVSLEAAPSQTADPQKLNILDNDGCRYSPRIMAMQKGERLSVRNKDPKLHIPHSYLGAKTAFTVSLPFRGTTLEVTQKIRQAGVLKVVCDTHAWMLAYIHVFDHPFFTVTDEQGRFSIPDVPPGVYTLKAWHEGAGARMLDVTVPADGEIRVDFDFTRR